MDAYELSCKYELRKEQRHKNRQKRLLFGDDAEEREWLGEDEKDLLVENKNTPKYTEIQKYAKNPDTQRSFFAQTCQNPGMEEEDRNKG